MQHENIDKNEEVFCWIQVQLIPWRSGNVLSFRQHLPASFADMLRQLCLLVPIAPLKGNPVRDPVAGRNCWRLFWSPGRFPADVKLGFGYNPSSAPRVFDSTVECWTRVSFKTTFVLYRSENLHLFNFRLTPTLTCMQFIFISILILMVSTGNVNNMGTRNCFFLNSFGDVRSRSHITLVRFSIHLDSLTIVIRLWQYTQEQISKVYEIEN